MVKDVCGDAALYCEPRSIESIFKSIVRLRDDEMLRLTLADRGQARLARFHNKTWQENALEILADARACCENG